MPIFMFPPAQRTENLGAHRRLAHELMMHMAVEGDRGRYNHTGFRSVSVIVRTVDDEGRTELSEIEWRRGAANEQTG